MNSDAVSQQDRIDELAQSFVTRYRAGERPSIEEYLQKYPDLAGELRDLLPALILLEQDASQRIQAQSPPWAGHVPPREIGDFVIVREIGRGGMGMVYEALQKSLSRRVALKVLPMAATLDERALQRFRNETMAVAQLDHPNIVDVYGVGSERGIHFYAMRYIEGASLAEIIDELAYLHQSRSSDPPESLSDLEILTKTSINANGADGPAPSSRATQSAGPDIACARGAAARDTAVQQATRAPTRHSFHRPAFFRSIAELGIQVADALDHAHQSGIIHRDIKPSNLLVDARGKAWVTDFGLARIGAAAGLTMTGDIVGTLRYMSPEQALAKRVLIDHRADIYSLGATLYELVALRPAFPAEDRRELLHQIAFDEPPALHRLNAGVPRELATIIEKAMTKSPAERYATAQDLAADLRRFLDDKPIVARPPSLASRVVKWSRRHRVAVAAASLLVALLAIGSSVGAFLLAQERDKTRAALAESEEQKRQLEVNAQQLKQEQRRAEVHFQKAREAVDRMFTRAAEEMANQPHMNQIRRRLLEDALEFYQDFLKTKSGDDDVRHEAAMAHHRVGRIYSVLGRHPEAVEHYETAREILETFVRKAPNETQYRLELAQVHKDWAYCEVWLFRREAGLDHNRKIAEIYEALHKDHPADRSFARMAVDSHFGMAMGLQEVGRHTEAIQEWQKYKDLSEKWVRDFSEPGSNDETPFFHHWYGNALLAVGDLPGAEKEFRQAHELRGKQLRDRPDDVKRKHDLAHIKAYLAGVVGRTGRHAEAIELFEQALVLCEECLDQFPDEADFLRRRGSTLLGLTFAFVEGGRLDDALATQQRLLAFYDRMSATEVDAAWILKDRGWTYYGLGLYLEAAGRYAEASQQFGKAIADMDALVHGVSKSSRHTNQLAYMLAVCPAAQFRDPSRAADLAKKLLQSEPASGDHWAVLGLAQYQTGDIGGAIESLEKAVKLASGGNMVDWDFLAMAYCKRGDPKQARQWFDKASQWQDKNKSSDLDHKRFHDQAAKMLSELEKPPGN